jgi:hypothetical protein
MQDTPSHRVQVLLCIVATLCLVNWPAWAQIKNPAHLTEPRCSRERPFTITIENGPATAAEKTIRLQRQGRVFDAQNVSYAGGAAGARVTGEVPKDLPFGDYEVIVYLDKQPYRATPKLSVGPPGSPEVHLNDFVPGSTYDTDIAYLPDPNHWEAQSVEVVRLQIEGAGLSGERTPVLLDGSPPEIVWNGCDNLPPLGSNNNPLAVKPGQLYGRVAGETQIELCRVPRGAKVTVSGLSVNPQQIGRAETMFIRHATRGIAMRMARLVLHGSGFQYDHPEDNTVWINRARAVVKWDTCSNTPDLGNERAPVVADIHGEVISPEEIKLCSIPVPDDGQMLISIGYGDTSSETRPFRVFSMTELRVALIAAVIALILALLPLGLLFLVKKSYTVAGENYKLRMLFLDPETDTYSLSKLQFYLWTVAALFGYAYLFISRVKVQNLTWPDIPATLPGIIAVAAGTAIGAQVITSAKGSKGSGAERPGLTDFITSGGVVAADRVQMFLWTLFGVGAFFVAVLEQGPGTISELPAVPERLLYLMGISSAGYLGGKLARKAGPVINEVTIEPPESDDAIAQASVTAAMALPDLVRPIVDAQAQMKSFAAVTNPHAKASVDALSAAIKAAGAAHTASEINELIATLGALRNQAEKEAEATASDFAKTPAAATQAEAETAQKAAATLQDFAADITQAISLAAVAPLEKGITGALIRRTIELRGTNLSSEGFFEIDHTDLPFRYLWNKDGKNAPEILVREDANPTFARVLRLTIDPVKLGTTDLEQLAKWFGSDGSHKFTLTNPDGQKTELTFTLGVVAGQKTGTTP